MVMLGAPLIDMQKGDGLAEEITKACVEFGCFRVVNHGVPLELMAEMKAVVASLFEFPEDVKKRTSIPNVYGKGYMGPIQAFPFLEGFNIDEISGFNEFFDKLGASSHQREIISKYTEAILNLAGLIGRKMMEGYGLTGDLIDEGWRSRLRMNKYLFCPESVGKACAPIHTDPSFLTFLQGDEGVSGLQVLDKSSGEFVPFDHVPGTLAVNIGDYGKAWSNGRYHNIKHRVFCYEPKTRYSIALFVKAPKDKIVKAPAELVDSEHPRVYGPIHVDKFMQARRTAGIADATLDLFKATEA